ncbi:MULTISPECIES: 2-hydroxychromene-2-carboxylate isomerase [unclassified Sulfitobacter]|jgi:2-hydroxychromene-2-carboxylate isomerase|nr:MULTISPECIES: 2-hydroxychromene-2-carboxylate isomerase [unclassified Sulfitobacter]KZY06514.1 disulfide bond formation protein DsbA [Sulfitobacter sp. HI0023]KZY27512.1 disulfide bond formation protein DsbA [Sulfitobacter sp. HI0040]KZZ63871.1 disulfide bond formation protein DsbA [Sulfitobacter sp. HI0129]
MSRTLEFIFDFGSPNAYLVHKVLPDLAARTGATIRYLPCLLGGIFKATGNQPPMMAFANVPKKMEYERLEMQRFIEKHGLTKFSFNPHFPVNTLLMMRGAVAMDREDTLAEYADAGFRFMWEDGLDMSDKEVFARAFTDAGFDGNALLEATQDPAVKTALVSNTEEAVERGVFGSPTFFVGEEMVFGKERLDQVEEMLNADG